MSSEKFGWQPIDMASIDKDVMLFVTDGQGEPYAVYKPFGLTAARVGQLCQGNNACGHTVAMEAVHSPP
jgi:hypothetical protein